MKIGVFQNGWWGPACQARAHQVVPLSIGAHASENAYTADLPSRMANGAALLQDASAADAAFWLDNGGAGLAFVRNPQDKNDVKLAHEARGRILFSHLIDPLSTSFQGLDGRVVWQCLASGTWVKAVWDKAHAVELARFGVPNVVHLPMAAPNRKYDTRPADPDAVRPVVSFIGGQNTTYFSSASNAPTNALLAGTLAQARLGDDANSTFLEAYAARYALGGLPNVADELQSAVDKFMQYYNAKLFHHAALCLRNRDRFVIHLSRRLGDRFELIGRGWDSAYGVRCAASIANTDDYFNHFRRTAVNLNFVNGNAETGLNMRHFEITAAGGFMLCQDRPELRDCFEPSKECGVFRTEDDLIDRIEHYLGHPEERTAIALAGQRRTLSQHLYSHRLDRIVQWLAPAKAPVEFSTRNWSEDCKALLPKADVVLDCGANVGQMAAAFRKAYPESEIYSFEPVAAVFNKLVEQCRTSNVRAVRKAVADRDGRAVIQLTQSDQSNSLLGYQEGSPCAQWHRVVGEEEIEVCTLDQWIADNAIDPRRVSLIKLDIQGAELKALYGARRLLEHVPLLLVEVSFVALYKDAPLFAEIDGYLRECGYRRHAVYPSDQPHNWGDALYVKGR